MLFDLTPACLIEAKVLLPFASVLARLVAAAGNPGLRRTGLRATTNQHVRANARGPSGISVNIGSKLFQSAGGMRGDGLLEIAVLAGLWQRLRRRRRRDPRRQERFECCTQGVLESREVRIARAA